MANPIKVINLTESISLLEIQIKNRRKLINVILLDVECDDNELLEAIRSSLVKVPVQENDVMIKVRLVNGKTIAQNFSTTDTLKDIYDWVFVEMGSGFN